MTHEDHVKLIQGGVEGHVWADMGSGMGAFTLALADILGAGGEIYSVDRDAKALSEQRREMARLFPKTKTEFIESDMTEKLEFPLLDGVLAANSIHFEKDRVGVLRLFSSYLKPGGKLLVIEYNADVGNTWVPYPFSFETFAREAGEVGFEDVKLLEKIPSQFLGEMYSAVAQAGT